MTWDWLLQLFKFEGQVIEVFVSQKRQKNNDNRFDFVRYNTREEALNAVKNLNGIRLSGKTLKVSFAKYERNGMA